MNHENYIHLQNITQKEIQFKVIDGFAYAIVIEGYEDYFYHNEKK